MGQHFLTTFLLVAAVSTAPGFRVMNRIEGSTASEQTSIDDMSDTSPMEASSTVLMQTEKAAVQPAQNSHRSNCDPQGRGGVSCCKCITGNAFCSGYCGQADQMLCSKVEDQQCARKQTGST